MQLFGPGHFLLFRAHLGRVMSAHVDYFVAEGGFITAVQAGAGRVIIEVAYLHGPLEGVLYQANVLLSPNSSNATSFLSSGIPDI